MTTPDTAPISRKKGATPIIPAGMAWDAAEYADKDGLEADADGTVFFADSRSDAWHQLGQVFGRAMTAAELMEQSHLGGWNVRKSPLQTITDDGIYEVPGRYAVVRTHPTTGKSEPLPGAVVGEFYTAIQNETSTDMLQAIVDESGAIFETAGSLNGGRGVFVTMKLPETMMIGGVDAVNLNIAWLNSHDGTSSQRTLVTPTRIVCQNTQRAAIKGAVSSYSIKHTSSAEGRIAAARQALKLTFQYANAFEAEAEKMIAAQMTKDQFVNITRSIWAKPASKGENEASKRAINIHAKREGELLDLFTVADTQENIRGTAWAGYQSIGEWLDHYQSAQVRDLGNVANARAVRTIMGRNDDEKLAAFAKTLAFASR